MASLRSSIQNVQKTSEQLRLAFDELDSVLAAGEEALANGATELACVHYLLNSGELELRRGVGAGIDHYESGMRTLRGQLLSVLHDEGGLSMAAAARKLKISRPLAERLFGGGKN